MKTSKAIELAGSAAALARLFGITGGAISQWSETVPPLRVWQLKEMRPEWFGRSAKKAAVKSTPHRQAA